MGGALAIASSVLVPEVDAVVAFYGVPSSELADPAQAKAPVQAHFGELDSFVGFSDVGVCCCFTLPIYALRPFFNFSKPTNSSCINLNSPTECIDYTTF